MWISVRRLCLMPRQCAFMRGRAMSVSINHIPGNSVGRSLGCGRSDVPRISGDGVAQSMEADVWTSTADEPRGRSGRQTAPLRRGTELSRVRGYRTREELIRLRVYEGKSLKECACLLGRHYNRVRILWQEIVAKSNGDDGVPAEHLANVRAYVDIHLRRVIQEASCRISEGAAYGAVVVAGLKALMELHGVKHEEVSPEGMTLADVGREVRVVSPLLAGKLERLERLGARVVAAAVRDGDS